MSKLSPASNWQQMELPSMPSAAAFPAKTFLLREMEMAWKASVLASGARSPVLLASYDHDTSSWRTLQLCLVEGLTVFSESWPRSGMMLSGTVYQLPTSAPVISETGCGLWPSPQASDSMRGRMLMQSFLNAFESHARRGVKIGSYLGLSCAMIGHRQTVSLSEWMMGLPIDWTSLAPAETQ